MQPQEMVAFFLFAVAAAVTPGPSNLLVMAAGARAGWAGGRAAWLASCSAWRC
jgi:threonine/homoserine/homoserine lactone efflux protein